MRSIVFIIGIALSLYTLASHQRVKQVRVPAEHIYVPAGYNEDENVELVVEGYLPNLCYKNPSAQINIRDKNIIVSVVANSSESTDNFCAEMIVPFYHVFSVGFLDPGKYNIVVNDSLKDELFIEESDQQENIFANVESIEHSQEKNKVILKGHHPSHCVEFDQFKIINNKKDVYTVFPLMKKISSFCPLNLAPFEYEMDIPKDLDAEKFLIHVRTMNGNSVNSIYSILK